jgi:hypothetical protein
LELTGWLLFAASGVGFVVAGLRAGQPWTVWASVLFLAAVLCFLIPFGLTAHQRDDDDGGGHRSPDGGGGR